MRWDPDHYLRFADHRVRPGTELLARIPAIDARAIVDLGSGTGHLTSVLALRWPEAEIVGIDSSVEMVERARRDHPHIRWSIDDIATWEPDRPLDLIFSNAALHWVDDHEAVFRRLRSYLAADGILAVQMPDNWDAPTHRIPADVLDDQGWAPEARAALMRDRLSPPASYAAWVLPASVDLWRTTYFQQLMGDDPVWTWVTGSIVRPVLASLDPEERDCFADECRRRYAAAYLAAQDGSVILPFSRLFIIARASGP